MKVKEGLDMHCLGVLSCKRLCAEGGTTRVLILLNFPLPCTSARSADVDNPMTTTVRI